MNKQLKVTQIVRKFGPVGGMETYVFNLVKSLSDLGIPVTVLCEEIYRDPPKGVELIRLPKPCDRPRWVSLLVFSQQLSSYCKKLGVLGKPNNVIHSHERTSVHNITTFHGPPFARIYEWPKYRLISPRVLAHLYLEYREILGAQVMRVIPNSKIIADSLLQFYPKVFDRLSAPICPGVMEIPKRELQVVSPTAGVVGFIGKEWKRKGLAYVKTIMQKLLIGRRDLELIVVGPCEEDVKFLFRDYPGKLTIKGWVASQDIFQSIDVLLHPAQEEPYGMVIAEAMAANVPVVISNHCGAAQNVTPDRGSVLSLNAELDLWASEVNNWLNNRRPMPGFCRLWSDVANEHLKIYEEVKFNQS